MNLNYSAILPAGPGQVVAYTGTPGAITNAFPIGARAAWIFCTSAAYVRVGSGVSTAASTDIPVPANVPIFVPFETNPGDIKVAAVQDTAGGNLHVLPLASL